jgi:hypothetical protein
VNKCMHSCCWVRTVSYRARFWVLIDLMKMRQNLVILSSFDCTRMYLDSYSFESRLSTVVLDLLYTARASRSSISLCLRSLVREYSSTILSKSCYPVDDVCCDWEELRSKASFCSCMCCKRIDRSEFSVRNVSSRVSASCLYF